ncbi:hypothetical protein [Paraburkholderia sp. ZP32-5]|uniref:hypothetical protein n=1 Tax=Paraburkholderia sp. ZP32-5 TaxID=2883245 RepID=UPI001F3AF148|nr:hypothetical protein [Paraburkholderia sp. ZP32-5]
MSKRIHKSNGVSLVQHFDPPTGYVGAFGWLCGYSADADFLDMAAERFTGQARAQRAHAGRIALAVMLDPGNPLIAPIDAPGVASLSMYEAKQKTFELLHAKVALLGFRDPHDPARWVVRLLVSTGNWTRETLEETLDLVWRVDVASDALEAPDAQTQLSCSDIHAAHDLLVYLADYFDQRLLTLSGGDYPSDTNQWRNQLDRWLDRIAECKRGHPRFFDNRNHSLLAQLAKCIERAGITAACHYLAMGSGFYETAKSESAVPKVLRRIVETLKEKGRLTRQCEIDVFVNPLGCQAVAQSVNELAAEGFVVRPAHPPAMLFPDGDARKLHAKFLFAANKREGFNNCTSAWIYLGSGNLTGPGFDTKAALGRGNLEAGVVFAPEGLCWYQKAGVAPAQVVTNLLPMQWSAQYDSDTGLTAGGDMPVRPQVSIASPVAWVTWIEPVAATRSNGRLSLPEPLSTTSGFAVLDEAGQSCVMLDGDFLWRGERPRQVKVRWTGETGARHETLLPVLDEFGRVAATGLSSLDLDEVAWQLAQFPSTPDDEGVDREGIPDDPVTGDQQPLPRSAPMRGDYAIRQMMELVENVAARQTAVVEADWFVWCNRLEQTLIRASNSVGVETFIELEINPLSPLRAVPFRPAFAELDNSEAGERYLEALRRIASAWRVDGLKGLEVTR